ncbi:MAG: hypothetical protein ABSG53_08285 [Thermoguttaceae bacterium]
MSAVWHAMDAYPDPLARPEVVAEAEIEIKSAIAENIVPTSETRLPVAPAVKEIAQPVLAEEPRSHVAMLDDTDGGEVFA